MCECFHIFRDIITVTSKGPCTAHAFPVPNGGGGGGGRLVGTQYRNTVILIGKYQNPESKIDEIPVLHL